MSFAISRSTISSETPNGVEHSCAQASGKSRSATPSSATSAVGAEFVHADKSPAAAELDAVLEELKNRGFIVGKNGIGRNVMAFQPPLVITEDNISDVLNALELVLTEKGL